MFVRNVLRLFSLLAVLVFAGACSVALAPPGDPELVAGINEANEQALILFSAVSAGSDRSEFAAQADRYDQIIGKFDALRIRAAARDVPTTALRIATKLGFMANLQKICPDDPVDCINASPASLQAIAENFRAMRAEHANSGLASDIVALFKQAHEISAQQALSVEMALIR